MNYIEWIDEDRVKYNEEMGTDFVSFSELNFNSEVECFFAGGDCEKFEISQLYAKANDDMPIYDEMRDLPEVLEDLKIVALSKNGLEVLDFEKYSEFDPLDRTWGF